MAGAFDGDMPSLPSHLSPMLAAPAGTLPPDLAGWAIEPKWDGVRLVADVTARPGLAVVGGERR